jgi:protein TonB
MPTKISDAQFIGDLMNLFERRKIPVGDPASFQIFESELASNDLLRSGLFTLCTAISHMAEADLSGEQLLALVARALAGPAVAKGAAIEIPDGMRAGFLKGYDAWSNRDSDIREPLPWPAPRPVQREEPATQQPDAAEEPIAVKPRAPGIHTVQEALEIAKKRFPAEPALPHPADMGAKVANIEGLTLSELKALLQDIERRVTRIQPQIQELDTMSRVPAGDFARREKMHEIDEALSAAEPLGASHRSPSSSKLNEAAFLARHAYLSPTRRVVPQVQVTAGNAGAAPAPAAIPVMATAAAPAPFVAAVPVAMSPAVQERVAIQPFEVARAIPFEPAVVPIAAPDPPKHYAEVFQPPTEVRAAVVAPPNPVAADPRAGSVYFRVGGLRLGPRTVLGSLVAFIMIAGGLGGILIYPSLHPYYFYSESGLQPVRSTDSPQSATPGLAPGTAVDSAAQMILTTPDSQSSTGQAAQSPHGASSANSGGSKSHPKTPPAPPISVWPATGASVAVAAPAVTPGAIPTSHWTASPSKPIYVPSATIINYALSEPQPIYPRDQPKGIVGTVVVQVTISRDGDVTDIRTLSGPVEMRPATVQAVQAWRFRPYLVNGTPVEVTTTMGFLFRGQ